MLKTDDIPAGQFDERFIQGMLNRVATSFHKYGSARDNTTIDWLASAQQRIRKYTTTGNKEWLIDACNYLMFEAMYPRREGGNFFRETSSDESPGRKNVWGDQTFEDSEGRDVRERQ